MPLPGYPDYARVQLAAGYLLAGGQKVFNGNTLLFQGYVGSWPYINGFWNSSGGSQHDNINMTYWSDDTFTQQVALQASVRDENCVGWRQYGVLSPWLSILVQADGSSSVVNTEYAFYGTTQKSSAAKLGSLDSEYFETLSTIGAGSTTTIGITKILPGRVSMSWYCGQQPGQYTLQRWDYGGAAWKTFWLNNILTSNSTDRAIIAMPDAPIQALLHNGSATSGNFEWQMMPVMD